jgi:hypothetical protein
MSGGSSGKASALVQGLRRSGHHYGLLLRGQSRLPVELIPRFAELALQSGEIPRTALVVDVREGSQLEKLPAILKSVKRTIPTRVIYLEASDAALCGASARRGGRIRWGRAPRCGHRSAPNGGICGRFARWPTWSSTPPNSMFMNCGRT